MLAYALPLIVFCLLCARDVASILVPLLPRTLPSLHPRADTSVAVTSSGNTQYLANLTLQGCVFITLR